MGSIRQNEAGWSDPSVRFVDQDRSGRLKGSTGKAEPPNARVIIELVGAFANLGWLIPHSILALIDLDNLDGYSVLEIGDVSQEQYLWSCSKVVTAMLARRLIHEGQIAGLDAIVPNTHPSHWYAYPGGGPFATFRQFMAMTSDYGLVPYLPNTHYAYNNNAVHFYGRYMGMEFFGTQEMHRLGLRGYDKGEVCIFARATLASDWIAPFPSNN